MGQDSFQHIGATGDFGSLTSSLPVDGRVEVDFIFGVLAGFGKAFKHVAFEQDVRRPGVRQWVEEPITKGEFVG